ncbi:unnamed protein product [Acidithrix sp. C25]|nr:unnamed protein product [Acidithrix sp. C25]
MVALLRRFDILFELQIVPLRFLAFGRSVAFWDFTKLRSQIG